MRISADCIDEEHEENSKDKELSEEFSRMALNDHKHKDSLTAEDIRVIYKVNYSSNESTVSLSVIPVNDNYKNGYQSNWTEVKEQVLDLNYKDKSKVPKTLTFIGRIESAGYELALINQDEYFTALKVAELCGQPLDVMIDNSVEGEVKDNMSNTASTSKPLIDTNGRKDSLSDSDNESNGERNGFVVLKPKTIKAKADSSTQLDNNLVVMSKTQIENIKKEITIDVTKRIISKLNECLTELTNETTVECPSVATSEPSAPPKVSTKGQSVAGNDLNETTAPVIHIGIICDNCDLQIKGIRYKCNNCLDFDLCEKCKELPSVHDKSHSFNKIERYIRGIPKQTCAQNLHFLKPFLTGATIDPNTRDIVLALDVDLRNGTISTTNISQPKPSTSSTTQTNEQNSNRIPEQTKDSDSNNTSNGAQNSAEEEVGLNVGSVAQRKYVSEKKANKIAKKLEKLRFKSQMYNNILQTSDERSSVYGFDRSKPPTLGPHIQNPQLNPNKTLYLSGLLVGDETIPEGTRMPSNTRFRKTWKVRNTGTKVWTGRTTLRFVWGHSELEPFGRVTEVQAPTLRPGEEGKVTIRFTSPSPSNTTRYQSHWRLHHRGQPFGQRLVCKIVVDPLATTITPAPSALLTPILAKDAKSSTSLPTASTRATLKSPYLNPNYGINGTTTCNFQSIAHIHQSILESQRNLSDRLKLMSNTKHMALNQNTEKTQKTSVKKLTEALSAVKEIRFDLEENDSIPLKTNVKSHTATPANTPFDVSPPKSPEPNSVSNSFTQIDSNDKNESNDSKEKNEENLMEDKANESDDSLDVLSLSSGESSDEFVLVPLPNCFDLNVPFSGVDNKGFEDISKDDNIVENPNDNNCFEVIEENVAKSDEMIESNAENTLSEPNTQNTNILDEPNNEIALDLTKDKHRDEEQAVPTAENTTKANDSQSEPQVRPKTFSASTNPFRNNPNDTENVIHVLPESIVTGALSAAAHVYNNVVRTSSALFSRNEGNNFAWVTSPPPAALPLPDMYWENRLANEYQMPQNYMTPRPPTNTIAATAPTAPTSNRNGSAGAPQPQPSRLTNALTQLYEMGFWNQKLNQELLEKNHLDVNDTIEDLLSPGKGRQRRGGTENSAETVVSHQPQNNRNNGFIEEFD